MYPKDNAIVVMVNGVEIPISNLPYQHPEGFCLFKINNSIHLSSELFSLQIKIIIVNTENATLTHAVWISGQIQIRQSGPGITLRAPAHGLQEVFMDLNALKVMQGIWKHLVASHVTLIQMTKKDQPLNRLLLFPLRLKSWTGWEDRPVDSVDRLMGKSDRSTAHPTSALPRMQLASPTPGSSLQPPAKMPTVIFTYMFYLFFFDIESLTKKWTSILLLMWPQTVNFRIFLSASECVH